jgi:hypothetical protein
MKSKQAAVSINWDGGSVGGGNSSRMLLAPNATGRYSYGPVRGHGSANEEKHKEEKVGERELQTATRLKVQFIDCLFAVR